MVGATLCALLTGCVEPVIRRNEDSAPLVPSQYDKADVKKRIWVVPLSSSFAWDPKQGEDPNIAGVLGKSLSEAFANPAGPFAISVPFGQGVDDTQADASTQDEELKRIAQATGADGYLKATVVSVDVLRTQLPDGLVKTNDYRILLKVSFEVFDAFSGRALYRGQEEEKYTEQRSDLLRADAKYPELDRRLGIMSKKLAERVYNSVLPASSRMGWRGKVLSVENARVYLNAGEKTGLRMGDVLKVVEPFKQIADFESGRVIGNIPGRIKGTIKIIQFFGEDGAIGVLQSGGGFTPGDAVQLY